MSYLVELTIRLATGLGQVDQQTRDRHQAFLLANQQPDGGFSGREGGSDLYYTGFALRALALLGVLEGEIAERAATFLRSRLSQQTTIIDFVSLLYGANLLEMAAGIDVFADSSPNWRQAVADTLE